jgi:recombinational DNA repair protein RecR
VCCRNSRSQSCPFCRDNLKKTDPDDLWIYVEDQDVVDMETVSRENLRRLFMYINKLPLIVPDVIFSVYDSHIK